MIWGEISAFVTARQTHAFEIERLKLQADVDAAQFDRNQIAIKNQHDMGVDLIHVQAEANIGRVEVDGWLEAVKGTTLQIGVKWVDAWNAMIRPGAATWGLAMITLNEFKVVTSMSDYAQAIAGAALGIYLADRSLAKRGK